MKYHRKLGGIALVLAILSAGQFMDHLRARQKKFKVVSGVVTDVAKSSFYTRSRRRSGAIYFTKTVVRIGKGAKEYYAAENSGADSLLQQLQEGDRVELSVRGFLQPISYIGTDANMFLVRKNGVVIYDNTAACIRSSKVFALVFGAVALFIWIIYLDVVKGISIENWYQRVVLKNPDYMDR